MSLSFTGSLTGSLGEDFLDCCGVEHVVTLDPDLTTWTALGRVTFVEVTGLGGSGGSGSSDTGAGGGGGGGYANKASPGVNAGDVVSYQSGNGSNDGSSWFKTTGTVRATAGDGGSDPVGSSGGTGGSGGTGTAGDFLAAGNNGGGVDAGLDDGGSGGNAGGPLGDGNGANGGAVSSGAGNDGDSPGGGGSGGGSGGGPGGAGAPGSVAVTYITCP
jgi:hypothetical protein